MNTKNIIPVAISENYSFLLRLMYLQENGFNPDSPGDN